MGGAPFFSVFVENVMSLHGFGMMLFVTICFLVGISHNKIHATSIDVYENPQTVTENSTCMWCPSVTQHIMKTFRQCHLRCLNYEGMYSEMSDGEFHDMLSAASSDCLVDDCCYVENQARAILYDCLSNEASMTGTSTIRRRRKRGFSEVATRWTPPILYSIDAVNCPFTLDHQNEIRNALFFYESNTCITFEETTLSAYDGILFACPEPGCSSHIGNIDDVDPQFINLQPPHCLLTGTVLHEILHALGVLHEQSRDDRDSYVTIFGENIIDGADNNFALFPSLMSTPYDYASVMHYSKTAFSIDPIGKHTLEPTQSEFFTTVGQRGGLSYWDLKELNNFYCPGSCPWPPVICQNHGYNNPANCAECLCPPTYDPQTHCGDIPPINHTYCAPDLTAPDQVRMLVPGTNEWTIVQVTTHQLSTFKCAWRIMAPPGYSIKVDTLSMNTVFSPPDLCILQWLQIFDEAVLSAEFREEERFCFTNGPTLLLNSTSIIILWSSFNFNLQALTSHGFTLHVSLGEATTTTDEVITTTTGEVATTTVKDVATTTGDVGEVATTTADDVATTTADMGEVATTTGDIGEVSTTAGEEVATTTDDVATTTTDEVTITTGTDEVTTTTETVTTAMEVATTTADDVATTTADMGDLATTTGDIGEVSTTTDEEVATTTDDVAITTKDEVTTTTGTDKVTTTTETVTTVMEVATTTADDVATTTADMGEVATTTRDIGEVSTTTGEEVATTTGTDKVTTTTETVTTVMEVATTTAGIGEVATTTAEEIATTTGDVGEVATTTAEEVAMTTADVGEVATTTVDVGEATTTSAEVATTTGDVGEVATTIGDVATTTADMGEMATTTRDMGEVTKTTTTPTTSTTPTTTTTTSTTTTSILTTISSSTSTSAETTASSTSAGTSTTMATSMSTTTTVTAESTSTATTMEARLWISLGVALPSSDFTPLLVNLLGELNDQYCSAQDTNCCSNGGQYIESSTGVNVAEFPVNEIAIVRVLASASCLKDGVTSTFPISADNIVQVLSLNNDAINMAFDECCTNLVTPDCCEAEVFNLTIGAINGTIIIQPPTDQAPEAFNRIMAAISGGLAAAVLVTSVVVVFIVRSCRHQHGFTHQTRRGNRFIQPMHGSPLRFPQPGQLALRKQNMFLP